MSKTMKKTMNWMLMALLMAGLSVGLTSCKEDELTEEEKQQQAGKALEEAQEWWDVVSQLTDEQILPDDWQTATFEPTIGTASETDPYTRIVATNDLATAAQRFAYLTGCPVTESTADYTWSHKQAGSLTYQAGTSTGTYLAQVDVSLKQMPKLKKILYQTPEQMGENASGSFSGTAYYRFGDVVRKVNSKGYYDYWVCVRPAFSLEFKGDSHWVCLSDLPDENLYTWENDGTTWVLPTKLGESKEHMQNFAEMIYAMVNPNKYYANLGANPKMKVFHDFSRDQLGKYHNEYFWERVCKAWEAKGLFEDVFNQMTKDQVEAMVESQGLSFIYKGYSWTWGWNCSLWEANYKGANLKTATYTTKKNDMRNVEFKANIFNLDQKEYCRNFFGDDNLRFILRYATGETLSKDASGKGNYSVKNALSNCEDVYVYNRYYYQHLPNKIYDLNSAPEVTPAPSTIHGFFAPGTVICDAKGKHWLCYSSWVDDPSTGIKSMDRKSRFLSFDAVESATLSVTSTDPAVKDGVFATNVVPDDEAFLMGIALRSAAHPSNEIERVFAASLRDNLGVNPADLVLDRDSVVTYGGRTATALITAVNLATYTRLYPVSETKKQIILRYITDGTRVAGNRTGVTDNYSYHYLYSEYVCNDDLFDDPMKGKFIDATHSFYWKGRTYENETVEDFYVPADRWSRCKRKGTNYRDGDFTLKNCYNEGYDWHSFCPDARPRRYSTYFEPVTFAAFLEIEDDDSPYFKGTYGGKKYTLMADPMSPEYKDLNFQFWFDFNNIIKEYVFWNDEKQEFDD